MKQSMKKSVKKSTMPRVVQSVAQNSYKKMFKKDALYKKVFPLFEKHLRPNDTILVGVSGGSDSVALLVLLKEYATLMPFTIIVAHLNHGMRDVEAQRDENFVKSFADARGLRCEVKREKLLKEGKTGLEERGRLARRRFFESLARRHNARLILTAHTQNDNAETILFHLIRGSGPAGLAGMQMCEGEYFRPLLTTQKSELLDYLARHKITYCHDSTNDDPAYARNYLRGIVIPLIEKLNPSFSRTVSDAGMLFAEIELWLVTAAREFLFEQTKKVNTPAFFRRDDFLSLPPPIQRSVIQVAASPIKNLLSFSKVDQVLTLIQRNTGNKKIELPGSMAFLLKEGLLYMSHVAHKN